MFRFEVDTSGPVWEGGLLYHTKECWFEFHCSLTGPANPVGWREIGSLAVHTLEINVEVDSCRLLWVVGWYPILPKDRGHLPLPQCEHGCVRLVTDRELIPGAPYGLGGAERWRPTHDPDTGWVCIGEVEAPPGADWVEFATSTVAVISQGELVALWLHPEFVP